MSAESEPPRRWAEEDRALLRALGGRISQIIHGEDLDLPDLQRRDELGILANMVSRLARELGAARRRDLQYRTELEHRVEQLQSAYRTQEKLLATIRELSSPVLEPFEGVVLLPIAGALDATRIAHVMPALLERVASKRPAAVIIHVTLAESLTPDAATLVLRTEQSVRHFGVRLILSGVPAEIMRGLGTNIDLTRVTLCSDLEDALTAAFDLLGYRLAR